MISGRNRLLNSIQIIPQLRWYMFYKFQCEISNLSPTTAALKYNIFHCHYVILVLRCSLSTLQNIRPMLSYGWESSGEAYWPILTDEVLAHLALIELSVYFCKTKSATNRFKYRKNYLQCSDMCKCVDCENDDAHHLLIMSLNNVSKKTKNMLSIRFLSFRNFV